MGKFTDIQDRLIKTYRIQLCNGTLCKNDWSRTHVHIQKRRICKWVQKNSLKSTFTLLHEIGHIEAHTGSMRRAESEYHATVWAMEKASQLGLDIPDSLIQFYQDYIDRTKNRGIRRGGGDYNDLSLPEYPIRGV